MFILPVAWLVAVLTGYPSCPPAGPLSSWPARSWLPVGCWRRISNSRRRRYRRVLAGLLGTIGGGAYGAEDWSVLAMLGAAFTIFVLAALVSSAVLPLRGGWRVIAVRVLGSWTAATGLLLIGWTLHGRS